MTDPNERSDPVEGFTDVTPEQLDALHTQCHRTGCEGYMKAQAARAIERSTGSLERLTAALQDVGESLRTATVWTQHMQGRNPWGHTETVQRTESSDAFRERLAAVVDAGLITETEAREYRQQAAHFRVDRERVAQAQARETLRAGLQHQSIGNMDLF